MKECIDCVFCQPCCNRCIAKGSLTAEADSCDFFLTIESAKYYATVRNGIYTSLGNPIEFGRKVVKSLKDAVDKSAELYDKT